MNIFTKVVLELNDGSFSTIENHSYDYDGPIHELKKGLEQQAQNTQFQQQQAQNFGNNAGTGFNAANNFYQSELALNPSGMSFSAT